MGRLRLVAERLRGSGAARYAAPAVFLLAATIAVLLIRSAIHDDREMTTSVAVPTVAKKRPSIVEESKPVTAAPAAQYHTIESGDTFGALAAHYGTTVDRLRLLNPDVDPDALRVGAKIRIR